LHSNWEVEFFRGPALDVWRVAISPEQTRAEVEFLRTKLRVSESAHLLDVPCGLGRHSIGLAQAGCRVTGVDLSDECIAEARASSATLPVNWITGDMRRIDWTGEFEGAFCMGNSFAYLSPPEASEFLRSMAKALKPGGRFIIDTGMAAESILPALQRSRWFRFGDLFMLSENQYDAAASRLDINYTFIRGAQVETRPSSSYVLTVSELCRMLRDAGLEPVELLGSVSCEAYQLGSPRLIVVSEKS